MRRLLRSAPLVLALLGLLALAACGGGGNDEFDFTGTWIFHETVTVNNGMPDFAQTGARGDELIDIVQNGTTIVLTPVGQQTGLVGTCDPEAGTFLIEFGSAPSRVSINGARTGDDTMSGEIAFTDGRGFVSYAYTADRL